MSQRSIEHKDSVRRLSVDLSIALSHQGSSGAQEELDSGRSSKRRRTLGGDDNSQLHSHHYSEPENEEIFQEKGWSMEQTPDP
jgi:hypothetical protein